ncbi:MAG: AraC family transcriptional regulator [Cupriavidus sp.]|jgi:AraC-like DNA-binding protein/mannose-6-phosphate isomerase-like protein (cupin superfamily)|uniref:AraC family transcriptional regulator n=1 Tax=Cupriavidus pauculus TaxID=82633 RepID=UPI0007802E04|nr:helix-turn-helix transcriptional regulator [Cupriavidus pauculus]MBU66575.1 AraC family transcriptional regulator [Cupriavidus sp.]MBY4732374.1 helix-turn-helix transcriptional regulator [Cupriavidus pauculus]
MLNIALDSVDDSPCAALAIGTDYAFGTMLDTHRHRRAQFLYGMSGLMEVGTDDGAWVVPPYTGVWIPPETPHRVRMNGVSTRSVYVLPQASPRPFDGCEVLVVSPLLHELLLASAGVPAHYRPQSRDGALMRLILHELAAAPTLPLFAPMPRHPQLAELCAALLARPDIRVSPDDCARQLNISPRTFSRLFRQQTGMAFGAWRQQACLLAALSRLAAGNSVTAVALDLGYDSPNAFSTMFRKALGAPPSAFQPGSR